LGWFDPESEKDRKAVKMDKKNTVHPKDISCKKEQATKCRWVAPKRSRLKVDMTKAGAGLSTDASFGFS